MRYFLAGTFVHPSIRRNGLAERLVQKALEVVSDDARGDRQSSAVVEVQVFERNVGAVKSYTKCGFKTIRSSSGEIATMTLDIEVA